jgi:hypothetical protein
MWIKISIHNVFSFLIETDSPDYNKCLSKKTMPCFLPKKKNMNKEITFIYSSIQVTRIFTNIFFKFYCKKKKTIEKN